MPTWLIVFGIIAAVICVHGFLGDIKIGNYGGGGLRQTLRGIKCLYGFHVPFSYHTDAMLECGIAHCHHCGDRFFIKR